ncbi:MAG: hypothetical protein IPG09_05970 [Ignavibacteria bacterium]|nr:hypothetical protein [Ignavibacteria bacterium]
MRKPRFNKIIFSDGMINVKIISAEPVKISVIVDVNFDLGIFFRFVSL